MDHRSIILAALLVALLASAQAAQATCNIVGGGVSASCGKDKYIAGNSVMDGSGSFTEMVSNGALIEYNRWIENGEGNRAEVSLTTDGTIVNYADSTIPNTKKGLIPGKPPMVLAKQSMTITDASSIVAESKAYHPFGILSAETYVTVMDDTGKASLYGTNQALVTDTTDTLIASAQGSQRGSGAGKFVDVESDVPYNVPESANNPGGSCGLSSEFGSTSRFDYTANAALYAMPPADYQAPPERVLLSDKPLATLYSSINNIDPALSNSPVSCVVIVPNWFYGNGKMQIIGLRYIEAVVQ